MKCLMCGTEAVYETDYDYRTCACGGMIDDPDVEHPRSGLPA